MKWFVAVAALVLVCATLGSAGAKTASQAAANGEMMYRVEEVVGTLVAATGMYEDGSNTWYLGDLRVDQGNGALKSGAICRIRFVLPTLERSRAPGLGDQIRIKLWQASPTEGWTATDPPVVVGRGEMIRPGEGAAEDLGKPTAKILVKMLAPLATDCHQKTAQLLREIAAREPDRVRVQIFDMKTPAGRQEMSRERLNCASVLVNNRLQFTLDTPTGERKVLFQHRPNEANSAYNSEDVITVVEQELKRLYPK
jgi:hypothetical protein